MQTFEIMKKGKWTASGGQTLDFSEDMLKQAVDAYDPELHEAPIVIGHPKDNGPAYGWIKSLSYSEGTLTAEPVQVDQNFAEMVVAGRFKKRSASFYLPDSPSNPKPGTLYLRHVGFLGAQPPAVKGLKDVNFNEQEEGVVEFADSGYVAGMIGNMARRLREWLIAEKGVEAADKIVPDYLVEGLIEESRRPAPELTAIPASFTEETDAVSKELQDKLTATEAKLAQATADLSASNAKVAQLEGQIASFKEREAKVVRAEIETRVDAAIKDGRVLPVQKKLIVDFAVGLADSDKTIDFGEGDKAEKVTQRELYLRQMEQGPKVVEFGERSGREPSPNGEDNFDINKAQRAISEQVASGGKVKA